MAGLDQAAGLQRPDRLADGQPAHLELRRQLGLGRELGPGLELAEDEVLQPLDDGVGDAGGSVSTGASMREIDGRQSLIR